MQILYLGHYYERQLTDYCEFITINKNFPLWVFVFPLLYPCRNCANWAPWWCEVIAVRWFVRSREATLLETTQLRLSGKLRFRDHRPYSTYSCSSRLGKDCLEP